MQKILTNNIKFNYLILNMLGTFIRYIWEETLIVHQPFLKFLNF